MNFLIKNGKNHKKTSSDFNSKSNKKVILSSSTMNDKQKYIKIQGNLVSNSIKRNYFIKGRKILGIKNNMKANNMSENITRDSNKKMNSNEFNQNEESKADNDIYDDVSTNNLTSTAINNESILNNTNNYFKRNLLNSSKSINNNNLKQNNTNNKINNNSILYKKNSLDCVSVYKSQSNKEIINISVNNSNINNNTNNNITQRCRHKQVKREIYINSDCNNTNRHIEIHKKDNFINSIIKMKNNKTNQKDKLNECEKRKYKISLENKKNIRENNNNNNNKNNTLPFDKINKNNIKNNSKNQSLSDLYSFKNKNNKKSIKPTYEDINKDNSKLNNNEKRNIGHFENNTINYKIKRIKFSYLNPNYCSSENNLINDDYSNLYRLTYLNNNDKKSKMNNQLSEELFINKSKSINKIKTKQIERLSATCKSNKRHYKRIKNQNILRNYNHNINNNKILKKQKDKDISFNEDDLDENTLSVSNGKYIENKKCQTMINKVFHFEAGSNEIFNNFRTNNEINGINNMNYLNKNQSTKSVKEKKNSCTTIINGNYLSNNNYNNSSLKKINNIIRNNIDYNLNKKKKIKNGSSLKKCYTDILIENNNKNNNLNKNKIKINNYDFFNYQDELDDNNNNDDNVITQEYYSPDNNNNSNKLNINNNNNSLAKSKNIRNIKIYYKRLFYKIFQCQEFKKYLFDFCDINLLNKICLLSKQIYKFMKPIIYYKINVLIYKSNNYKNNLKIKKYLMEKYSPLSKLSPALMRKKYTDLKFENNHKYDTEIKNDLTRTFPDNNLFKYGNTYYNKLYHVLTAFSNYNKNIGYAQGLNFLAANIIYFFEEEIDEFIFLDALIHKFDLEQILCKSSSKFSLKKLEDITKYIKQKLPKLSNHLTEMKLNYEYFTTNWVFTLFSNSMETKYLFSVWDYMIIFGWKFFRCFVVSVLIEFENEILNSKQNNITFIMKNMLKNKQFNSKFQFIIIQTIKMLIKENDII